MASLVRISVKDFFDQYLHDPRMRFPWQFPDKPLLHPKVIFFIGDTQYVVDLSDECEMLNDVSI